MVTNMTRAEYLGCIRALVVEMDAAERSGDDDRRTGAAMAMEAFLSTECPPPELLADLERSFKSEG